MYINKKSNVLTRNKDMKVFKIIDQESNITEKDILEADDMIAPIINELFAKGYDPKDWFEGKVGEYSISFESLTAGDVLDGKEITTIADEDGEHLVVDGYSLLEVDKDGKKIHVAVSDKLCSDFAILFDFDVREKFAHVPEELDIKFSDNGYILYHEYGRYTSKDFNTAYYSVMEEKLRFCRSLYEFILSSLESIENK